MTQWKATRSLLKGLSHIEKDRDCEDYVQVDDGGDRITTALADGVGSLSHSYYAAKAATDATVNWFHNNEVQLRTKNDAQIDRMLKTQLLAAVRQAIQAAAENEKVSPDKMDCNLAFCWVRPQWEIAVVGQLGDCAVCLLHDDVPERRSEVISDRSGMANSTNSVMSHNAAAGMVSRVFRGLEQGLRGFVLTSDGMDGIVYRKNSRWVCQRTQEIVNAVLPIQDREERDDLLEKNLKDIRDSYGARYDDDISMAIITCGDQPIQLAADPYWPCKCGHRNPLTTTYCQNCGMDRLILYADVDFSKYEGGVDQYFEDLNRKMARKTKIARKQAAEGVPGSEEPETPGQKAEKAAKVPHKTKVAEEQDKPEPGPADAMRQKLRERQERRNAGEPEKQEKPARKSNSSPPRNHGSNRDLVFHANEGGEEVQTDYVGQDPNQSNQPRRGRHAQRGRADQYESERQPIAIGAIIALVVVTMVIIGLGIKAIQSALPENIFGPHRPGYSENQTDEESESAEPATEDETDPPLDATVGSADCEFCHELENGAIFYGDLRDGKPHGYGTLMKSGTVWTGYFDHGKKNGAFAVTIQGSEPLITHEIYEDDVLVDTLYDSSKDAVRTEYRLRKDVRDLRKDPDYGAETLRVDLKRGDTVYLTGSQPVPDAFDTDLIWVEIRTEFDMVGWCDQNCLVPVS